MPAPSASFILQMLSPYQGFDPNEGARSAIAAGQLGESRANRRQGAEQFSRNADRADAYFGLEQARFTNDRSDKQRDQQIDAFQKFNDALINGDEEQAGFWASQLQSSGVGVEEYGGESAKPGAAAGPVAGTTSGNMPSRMDAYAPPGAPSASGAAAAAATPKPPGRFPSMIGDREYDPQTGNILNPDPKTAAGAAAAAANKAMPGDPMDPMGTPSVRPAPARAMPPEETPPPEAPKETVTGPEDSAGAATETPAPPGKGYRLRVAGRTIDLSPEEIRGRQETRVRETLGALSTGASSPAEKRAAEAATNAAVKAIPIYGVRGATKIGIDHYEQELERGGALQRAKYAASGRQVSVGFNKEDTMRQSGVFDDVETIVRGFEGNDEVKQARAAVAGANKIMELVKSNNSIGEWAAAQQTLKDSMRGTVSDFDAKNFGAAAGKLNLILKEFNAWFDGGAMPTDINRKLGELAIANRAHNEKKLVATAERAYQYTLRNRALASRVGADELQDHASNVYMRIAGRERPRATEGGGKATTPGTGAKPGKAPPETQGGGGGDKQKRADELVKKMRRR